MEAGTEVAAGGRAQVGRWLGEESVGFAKQWDDHQTKCQPSSVAIWRPFPPKGWFSLGDVVENVTGYSSSPSSLLLGSGALVARQKTRGSIAIALQSQKPRVFGVPLSQAISARPGSTTHVPAIVESCATYLLTHGISTVGIFRVDMSKDTGALVEAIDNGAPIDFAQVKSPHMVAGVLKKFLRLLPEPLLTFKLWDPLANAVTTMTSAEDAAPKLATLLKSIPEPNYHTLRRVLHLCHTVAANSESNRMPAANLAALIGPNVLYPPPDASASPDTMLQNVNTANAAIEVAIQHFQRIFDDNSGSGSGSGTTSMLTSGVMLTSAAASPVSPPGAMRAMMLELQRQEHGGDLSSKSAASVAHLDGHQETHLQVSNKLFEQTVLLVTPSHFVKIWDDKGTGAKFGDLSIWMPIPPSKEYVAMGCVVTMSQGDEPPPLDIVRCVHRSLVKPTTDLRCAWKNMKNNKNPDVHKGESGRCSLWVVPPPSDHTSLSKQDKDNLMTGLFLATNSWERPDVAYVFRADTPNVDILQEGIRPKTITETTAELKFTIKNLLNAAGPTCMSCSAQFSVFKRRHSCHLCGGVYCGSCCTTDQVGSRRKLNLICHPCTEKRESAKEESLELLKQWRSEEQNKESEDNNDIEDRPRAESAPKEGSAAKWERAVLSRQRGTRSIGREYSADGLLHTRVAEKTQKSTATTASEDSSDSFTTTPPRRSVSSSAALWQAGTSSETPKGVRGNVSLDGEEVEFTNEAFMADVDAIVDQVLAMSAEVPVRPIRAD